MLSLLINAIFVACTDYDNMSNEQQQIQSGNDPIYNLVDDYYQNVSQNSRTNSNLIITKIDRQTYKIEGDTVIKATTNSRTIDDNEYFDLCIASFEANNETGYAILSDDSRLNRVYFFTENGCITDTAYIDALKDMIDYLPSYIGSTILSNNEENSSLAIPQSRSSVLINNIVRYNWSQGYPYNIYAPYCSCNTCSDDFYRNHKPMGCVTIATAQAIATIGKFTGTFYGNKDIDFSRLPSSCYSASYAKNIAQFLHEVALCCQIKFGCGGSGSYVKSAYQYLKDLGYDCTYSESTLNINKLIAELESGIPHLVGGKSSDSGHMWIISGIRSTDTYYDFYCNWGWGHSNGWSIGNVYTPKEDQSLAYSKNLRYIYINSK
jgi:hypothetical protein